MAEALARAPTTTFIRCASLNGDNQRVARRIQKAAEAVGATATVHPRFRGSALAVLVVRSRSLPAPLEESRRAGVVAGVVITNRRAGEAVLKGAELYVPGVLACSADVLAGDTVEIFAAVEAAMEGAGGDPAAAAAGAVALPRGTTLPSLADADDDFDGDEGHRGGGDHHQGAAAAAAAIIAHHAAEQGGFLAVPVGAGTMQMTRAQVFAADKGMAVRVQRRHGARAPPPPPMDLLLPSVRGETMQQNLPSIVAVLALAPPPGARVLDMCSAPGGKSTLLAWLVAGGLEGGAATAAVTGGDDDGAQQQQQQQQGGGTVIALDRTHAKADEVRALARELGVGHIVDARKMDATRCCCGGAGDDGEDEDEEGRSSSSSGGGGDKDGEEDLHHHHNNNNNNNNNGSDKQQQPQASTAATTTTAASSPAPPPPQPLPPPLLPPPLNAKALARACRRVGVMRARRILTPEKVVLEMRRNGLPERLAAAVFGAANEAAAALDGAAPEPRVIAAVAEAASAAATAEVRRGEQQGGAGGGDVSEKKNKPFAPGSFSHILLDAPCSAMGLRPRLVQPHTLASLRRMAHYQRRLLRQAVRLLAPGGALVFSTCSVSPLENEANVRFVLDRYSDMRLAAPPSCCPVIGGPGLTEPADRARAAELLRLHGRGGDRRAGSGDARGEEEEEQAARAWLESLEADLRWLSPDEARLVQRFDPAAEEDTIGFFVARFEKKKKSGEGMA